MNSLNWYTRNSSWLVGFRAFLLWYLFAASIPGTHIIYQNLLLKCWLTKVPRPPTASLRTTTPCPWGHRGCPWGRAWRGGLPSPDLGEVLTGAELAEASGVEEPSSPHGVELEHEEHEGQAAEDEREHHEHLHCLQPACRGRHSAVTASGVYVLQGSQTTQTLPDELHPHPHLPPVDFWEEATPCI